MVYSEANKLLKVYGIHTQKELHCLLDNMMHLVENVNP